MRCFLSCCIVLALLVGSCFGTLAQGWQPSVLEGVPKPPAPRPLTPGQFMEEQAARIRATNQAMQDEAGDLDARQAGLQAVQPDIAQFQRQLSEQAAFNAAFEARNKPAYAAAYQALADMLDGRRTASLPLAVFMVENTYLDNTLNYTAYKTHLQELAALCRTLAGNDARPVARFMALHRLMTDTVQLNVAGQAFWHVPYRYDLVDFWGKTDHTKQFVTKLLRTGTGQCHSMPLLYKMLADQLGVKSYISLSPNHSFIQVKDGAGRLYRYETTNGHFVTDAYHMTTGYIKARALKCGAYLDTLTTKQNLACQVLDLAQGYEHYYGYDAFVDQCTALALRHYPNSMQGHVLAYDAALAHFSQAAGQAGVTSLAAALQLPALNGLAAEVKRTRLALDTMGFEPMPPAQYAAWLQSLDKEKARQDSQRTANRFQHTAR